MPRKKGFKSPNSRTETFAVRLTQAEQTALQTNAANANLSVGGFVRARSIPPLSDGEKLIDPKPGQSRRFNRTPLTRALQRILLNLQQIDSYLDDVKSDQLFEDFGRVRQALRDLQTDHLEASLERTKPRMIYVDDFNQIGRNLNRVVSTSHQVGKIKDPSKLSDILSEIDSTIKKIVVVGEGAN